MAKISFNKLGLTKHNNDINTLEYNDQIIEVKTYLPIQEKLLLIQNIINSSIEEEGNFYNPGKVDLFLTLNIIEYYTNIKLTPKQKNETFCETYDLLISNGLFDKIIEAIPQEEISALYGFISESVSSVYEYRTSAMGILESLGNNYEALDFEATEIQKKLADPNNLQLLREIAPALGLK